ncbi:hypothetical protein PV11_07132 [Exophiala sideris]|uniref:Uncharacterized protein n=1 Tax=Exophiala sideris TaxID=1016849 RepID=A0A0D1WWQ2_9EURO|nr:hypothetical protein PV11_07132 [Exophiala sideris]
MAGNRVRKVLPSSCPSYAAGFTGEMTLAVITILFRWLHRNFVLFLPTAYFNSASSRKLILTIIITFSLIDLRKQFEHKATATMSSGTSVTDEKISASKIEPLSSEVKTNTPHDQGSRGVAGTDHSIDASRIEPLGGAGHYKHPAPHADSHGVVGRDETIQGAKLEPLEGKGSEPTSKSTGLDDEEVDASRINPLGEVREELS